jgi:hypothetical protein
LVGCGTYGTYEKNIQLLVFRKFTDMRLLEYIDDNIKSDIEEIGCLNMD